MSRIRSRRSIAALLLVAGCLGVAAPGVEAAAGVGDRVLGRVRLAAGPALPGMPPGGGGFALRAWVWLAGLWAKEGATIDPHGLGRSSGTGEDSAKVDEGATIDPNGRSRASSVAGCPNQADAGATIDPSGACGSL